MGRLPPGPLQSPLGAADRSGLDRLAAQVAGQVVGQVAGPGVALARLLLQALERHRLEVARHLEVQPPRGDGVLVADLLEGVVDAVPLERRPARQRLVQDRPQRVDVGGGADLDPAAVGLLGRHVTGRAQDRPVPGQVSPRLVEELRQAEVGDLRMERRGFDRITGIGRRFSRRIGVIFD
jgi:hypothetical protein